jgi:hypothetical protein
MGMTLKGMCAKRYKRIREISLKQRIRLRYRSESQSSAVSTALTGSGTLGDRGGADQSDGNSKYGTTWL